MSSEHPTGEAESIQLVSIAELPVATIGPLPPAEASNIFERLRSKWTTIGAVILTGLLFAKAPSFEAQPAHAANTETAVVDMPFAGEWSTNVHPLTHANYSADWATDIYAQPGTEARFNVGAVSGNATYTVSNVEETSCGAGKRVRINVTVDNVNVGWTQYDHLETNMANDMVIQDGDVIGKTKNWGNLSCYQVNSDNGVHLHVGMKNVQDNHSCYVDHANQGVSLSEEADVGVLGSTNTGTKQACSTVPSGTTPPPGGTPSAPGTTTPAAYNPNIGTFDLRNTNTSGNHDITLAYGNLGVVPLKGDWNGDGIDTVGAYNPSIATFDLRNSNTSGNHDITLAYGNVGAIPLVGDWDGDGDDTIGVYNPTLGTFDLRNSNTSGTHDITLAYGNLGVVPLVGDWNNDGYDTIGVYNPTLATFDLRNTNTSGNHDITLAYGNVGAKPVVGDWDGDGDDTIGVYNPNIGTFDLRNTNTTGTHDITLAYGNSGIKPLVGDRDGL